MFNNFSSCHRQIVATRSISFSRKGEKCMDSTAPIIPGKSAAGILIGSSIETILKEQDVDFLIEEVKNPFMTRTLPLMRYCSVMVDLWVKAGAICQIMVHDGYTGKLLETIGLGSTIADVETQIGPWGEDEEDNLIIQNLPGLCFTVEGYFSDLKDPAFRQATIKEIYVFKTGENS